MQEMMFGGEKFTYDNENKAIYVDNYEKGSRSVFWVKDDGTLIQKTKTGCSAEGLILLYKTFLAR